MYIFYQWLRLSSNPYFTWSNKATYSFLFSCRIRNLIIILVHKKEKLSPYRLLLRTYESISRNWFDANIYSIKLSVYFLQTKHYYYHCMILWKSNTDQIMTSKPFWIIRYPIELKSVGTCLVLISRLLRLERISRKFWYFNSYAVPVASNFCQRKQKENKVNN